MNRISCLTPFLASGKRLKIHSEQEELSQQESDLIPSSDYVSENITKEIETNQGQTNLAGGKL